MLPVLYGAFARPVLSGHKTKRVVYHIVPCDSVSKSVLLSSERHIVPYNSEVNLDI